MKQVKSEDDLRLLYPGKIVRLFCRQASDWEFVVSDTQDILDGSARPPNPVTIVTVDKNGRPHQVVVSAYTLVVPYDHV